MRVNTLMRTSASFWFIHGKGRGLSDIPQLLQCMDRVIQDNLYSISTEPIFNALRDEKCIYARTAIHIYPYRVKMYSGTQSFGIPDAIWEWEVGWSLSSGSLLLPISKMYQQTFCILASQQSWPFAWNTFWFRPQSDEDSVNLTKNYRILTSKNEINNKFVCNLLIRTAKIDELAFTVNLFYTLCV